MGHEPELLDIAQAAAFLRVSETSLRRWTNAGRLRCFRLGGRRERRFRRADLLAFMDGPGETAAVPPPIPGHRCALYTSDAARDRRAAEHLVEGLAAGSICFLLAAPRVRERVLALVARRWPSARQDARSGRLLVSAYRSDAAAQLEFWETCFAEATSAGATSLYAVGDVSGTGLGRSPLDQVLELEREYDRRVSRRFPVASLCLYDARRLSGVDASRMLQAHGDMLRDPGEALVS
jgi:excisionase family DNA binding protein